MAVAGTVVLVLLAASGFGAWRVMDSRSFQLFGRLVERVNTSQKVVALTFDDGPKPGPTEEALRILDQAHATATFFAVGESVEQYPGLATEILAAGDELGNHSYSHAWMVLRPMSFYASEIERTDRLLRHAGQRGEILFRPQGDSLLPPRLVGRDRLGWPPGAAAARRIRAGAASQRSRLTADSRCCVGGPARPTLRTWTGGKIRSSWR
jgi:peptidoglycan/xylan/chitin deacetylase (PgdA/CDA1 family)